MTSPFLFQTPVIIPDEAFAREYASLFFQLNVRFSLLANLSKNIALNTEILINTSPTDIQSISEVQWKIKALLELKGILTELLQLPSTN